MFWEGVDWIDLPEHNDKWQASLNAATNLRFHKAQGVTCLGKQL